MDFPNTINHMLTTCPDGLTVSSAYDIMQKMFNDNGLDIILHDTADEIIDYAVTGIQLSVNPVKGVIKVVLYNNPNLITIIEVSFGDLPNKDVQDKLNEIFFQKI
ncbi:uncharacterized protein LOC119684310 [Teleopsis dalmanni]|uniref:uncharacterized protein LOC119684310 n=1 Tax=Teleopsis dalmanni TaxID=139649 RepID=UPI0018CF90F0|nr:uncharacterized protein LOC119684310 [Teleopsis dalmanni]